MNAVFEQDTFLDVKMRVATALEKYCAKNPIQTEGIAHELSEIKVSRHF